MVPSISTKWTARESWSIFMQSGYCYENHLLEQNQWIVYWFCGHFCTHVHLVTQELHLCSCLRKCKWDANRNHNDIHCTYCKQRTKQRISLLKIGEGGSLAQKGGVAGFRNPWNPSLATPLLKHHKLLSLWLFVYPDEPLDDGPK